MPHRRSLLRESCVCLSLSLSGLSTAAEPAAVSPRTETTQQAPGRVGTGRCPPRAAVRPHDAQSDAEMPARSAPAPASGPYGDAHYAAARLDADIERALSTVGCEAPVAGAFGAREAWERVDEAADHPTGEAAPRKPASPKPSSPKPAKPPRR